MEQRRALTIARPFLLFAKITAELLLPPSSYVALEDRCFKMNQPSKKDTTTPTRLDSDPLRTRESTSATKDHCASLKVDPTEIDTKNETSKTIVRKLSSSEQCEISVSASYNVVSSSQSLTVPQWSSVTQLPSSTVTVNTAIASKESKLPFVEIKHELSERAAKAETVTLKSSPRPELLLPLTSTKISKELTSGNVEKENISDANSSQQNQLSTPRQIILSSTSPSKTDEKPKVKASLRRQSASKSSERSLSCHREFLKLTSAYKRQSASEAFYASLGYQREANEPNTSIKASSSSEIQNLSSSNGEKGFRLQNLKSSQTFESSKLLESHTERSLQSKSLSNKEPASDTTYSKSKLNIIDVSKLKSSLKKQPALENSDLSPSLLTARSHGDISSGSSTRKITVSAVKGDDQQTKEQEERTLALPANQTGENTSALQLVLTAGRQEQATSRNLRSNLKSQTGTTTSDVSTKEKHSPKDQPPLTTSASTTSKSTTTTSTTTALEKNQAEGKLGVTFSLSLSPHEKKDGTEIMKFFDEQEKNFQKQFLSQTDNPPRPKQLLQPKPHQQHQQQQQQQLHQGLPKPGPDQPPFGLENLDSLVKLMQQLTSLRDRNYDIMPSKLLCCGSNLSDSPERTTTTTTRRRAKQADGGEEKEVSQKTGSASALHNFQLMQCHSHYHSQSRMAARIDHFQKRFRHQYSHSKPEPKLSQPGVTATSCQQQQHQQQIFEGKKKISIAGRPRLSSADATGSIDIISGIDSHHDQQKHKKVMHKRSYSAGSVEINIFESYSKAAAASSSPSSSSFMLLGDSRTARSKYDRKSSSQYKYKTSKWDRVKKVLRRHKLLHEDINATIKSLREFGKSPPQTRQQSSSSASQSRYHEQHYQQCTSSTALSSLSSSPSMLKPPPVSILHHGSSGSTSSSSRLESIPATSREFDSSISGIPDLKPSQHQATEPLSIIGCAERPNETTKITDDPTPDSTNTKITCSPLDRPISSSATASKPSVQFMPKAASLTSSSSSISSLETSTTTTSIFPQVLSAGSTMRHGKSSHPRFVTNDEEDDAYLIEGLATKPEPIRLLHKSSSCKSAELELPKIHFDMKETYKRIYKTAWKRVKGIIPSRKESSGAKSKNVGHKKERKELYTEPEDSSEVDIDVLLDDSWDREVFAESLLGQSTPRSSPYTSRVVNPKTRSRDDSKSELKNVGFAQSYEPLPLTASSAIPSLPSVEKSHIAESELESGEKHEDGLAKCQDRHTSSCSDASSALQTSNSETRSIIEHNVDSKDISKEDILLFPATYATSSLSTVRIETSKSFGAGEISGSNQEKESFNETIEKFSTSHSLSSLSHSQRTNTSTSGRELDTDLKQAVPFIDRKLCQSSSTISSCVSTTTYNATTTTSKTQLGKESMAEARREFFAESLSTTPNPNNNNSTPDLSIKHSDIMSQAEKEPKSILLLSESSSFNNNDNTIVFAERKNADLSLCPTETTTSIMISQLSGKESKSDMLSITQPSSLAETRSLLSFSTHRPSSPYSMPSLTCKNYNSPLSQRTITVTPQTAHSAVDSKPLICVENILSHSAPLSTPVMSPAAKPEVGIESATTSATTRDARRDFFAESLLSTSTPRTSPVLPLKSDPSCTKNAKDVTKSQETESDISSSY